LSLTKKDLKELILSSKKSVVKVLAVELGLGGVYAEELCVVSGVNKENKQLSDDELDSLFEAIKRFRNLKIDATVVRENDKIKVIAPFELESCKGLEQKKVDSFNLALDNELTNRLLKAEKQQKLSKHQKKVDKLDRILEKQEGHVKKLSKAIVDNTKKGELLYSEFKLVEEILTEINLARKTKSFAEMKKKLKGHKIVKSINGKTKEIEIELD